MKQIEFIQILANTPSESFKTEELLHTLAESAPPEHEYCDIRKCMHNHLSRLEKQNLVERLSPKRTRNATFKRLFNFDTLDLNLLNGSADQVDLTEYKNNFQLIAKHVKDLKEYTNSLNKKREVFCKLTESYKVYEPLIKQKLSKLDSELLDKKIELEAVNELINIINGTSTSNTLCRPSM
ncbi:hypothetical protein ACR30L_16200 [Psychromonas sp. PT13]|uniref:hypothetical protein n=1 Tax=Psychromonas sp. PT13 TaxID=3439547 RepID=UPI003EBFC67F